MDPAARRDAILKTARDGGGLEVERLARATGASRETIRRDLAALDRAGLLRRVHGGAVAVAGRMPSEEPFPERMQVALAAKRAIARHVAGGLRPGDSLFLDTGSTTLILAEALSACKGLIVITNSADIATLAGRGEGASVVLLGGEFRGPGRETVGAMAVAQIEGLRAAQAILTVAALTPQGALDIDPREAEVARAMVRQAGQVTVLADSTKMHRPGVFEVCPMARIGRIVTDGMPADLLSVARAAGTAVEIVTTG